MLNLKTIAAATALASVIAFAPAQAQFVGGPSNVTTVKNLLDSGKDADGSRYEILPIRTAIASGLFPKETERLTNAISRLRTRTESDFDSGK